MKTICAVYALLCLSFLLQAQGPTYYFKHYQVADGLSTNTVTAVIQDKKGFIWLGTRNGLNRFDGYHFRVFRHKREDPNSLGNNSILSLYEDTSQRLWVGTYKGIYLYDAVGETFTLFPAIPTGEVRHIKGDGAGNIWMVCDLVLYQYEMASGKVTAHRHEDQQTLVINTSESGVLFAATSGGIIRKYDPNKKTFQNFSAAEAYGNRLLYPINALGCVDNDQIVIGTLKQAILLNLKSMRTQHLFAETGGTKDVNVHTVHVRSLDEPHAGGKAQNEIWLGTEEGISIHKLHRNEVIKLTKEDNNPYSLSDNKIFAIYEDKEGGIWVGSYFGGINYYSAQYNNFHKYFPEKGQNSISGNIVHEIIKDPEGKLWIGTEDAGLNHYDPETGRFTHFYPDAKPGSISYHNIHGLAVVGNHLWIGTYEHGIDVMDLHTRSVVRHYDGRNEQGSFGSNFIVSLYTRNDGQLLVGTWSGLYLYHPQRDDFELLPFFGAQIQSMAEDKQGTLWVGTYGNGLYYDNPKTGEKGHINTGNKTVPGLINDYINNVYIDSRNQIWLCTEGGLCRYDVTTGHISSFTVEDGLSDNQVFRIMEDESGLFWISTSNGLNSYDAANDTFQTYYSVHGLPTEQFNYNSSYKDGNGTMYFGTVRGLISFDPADFFKNDFVPPLYFTGLQVNNQPLTVGEGEGILKRSILYTDHLEVPYDRANLQIDVASLSYTIPQMNAYSYKLDGLEDGWTTIQGQGRIAFNRLNPGDYTLRVKAANSDGIWNEQEAVLRITVHPPIWATKWAYALYVLLVAGIVVTIFWYYFMATKAKHNQRLQLMELNKEREIYNGKIEFFTNIAHEIRTPLTLIKMPLDKLVHKQFEDSEMAENINMINKNTDRLIDLTNQLLDFRKAEANKYSLSFRELNINSIMEDTYSRFKPQASEKGMDFRLELPRMPLWAFADEEALVKILSNLISNAIKYGDKAAVIRLYAFNSDDTHFHIEVRNDGSLIDGKFKEKIFEPFFRLKDDEKATGTGIGLPLARSLAELHHGKLELILTGDMVNIFLLSLPIHQDREIKLIQYDTNEAEQVETAETAAPETAQPKPVLLLVEDNQEILRYLSKELSFYGLIETATNGKEALEVLYDKQIHVIISDIMMPVMDGIALCKKVKTDFNLSHIPIILLTAKNSLESKIEGLEVGADAYIEKPFSVEHLLAQTQNLLSNREQLKTYFAKSPLAHIKGIAYSKADKDFLEMLNHVINEHITDAAFDIDRLSELMNISRPTLYRKIKGISNLTPNELINLTRLKKAAELLAKGGHKINEVAYMIGYSSPSNFSRDFQKQFGVSPTSYLEELQEK